MFRCSPWVDRIHIQLIIDGEIDLNNLPKLLRDEQTRRKHNAQSLQRMFLPVTGGAMEMLSGNTNCTQSSLTSFLSSLPSPSTLRLGHRSMLHMSTYVALDGTGYWPRI